MERHPELSLFELLVWSITSFIFRVLKQSYGNNTFRIALYKCKFVQYNIAVVCVFQENHFESGPQVLWNSVRSLLFTWQKSCLQYWSIIHSHMLIWYNHPLSFLCFMYSHQLESLFFSNGLLFSVWTSSRVYSCVQNTSQQRLLKVSWNFGKER